MNPLVRWWRDCGGEGLPRAVLVMVGEDDPQAVSLLAPDHGARWDTRGNPTGRVASHLDVPVLQAGEDLPPHDLLLLGEVGRGLTSTAARLAVGMFGAEAQLVVGTGSGIDDVAWMSKVAMVRDHPLGEPPASVMTAASLIEDSPVPVLLDGVLCAAAAAVASTDVSLQAPVLGDEPVQSFLLERSETPSWGLSGLGPGEGLGALSGLANLQLALLAAG